MSGYSHATLLSLALGSLGAMAIAASACAELSVANSFQGVGDVGFNTKVARPAYVNYHPKVLLDEAHNNFYTSVGAYKPFVDLIASDGYRVAPNKVPFSKSSLVDCKVLVIVNASGPTGSRERSPFTAAECAAVRNWVGAGGALLLIAEQAPFSAAVSELSKRFGVSLTNGYTFDPSRYNKDSGDQTELVFTRDEGLLGAHPIIEGRNATERINRIITFTGTSLVGPARSAAFLKLGETAMDVLPPDRNPGSPTEPPSDHKTVSAAGRAQAVALNVGKGRVVFLGEAAMLTALVMPNGLRFGMNMPNSDNFQLALNIMHWLSRLL